MFDTLLTDFAKETLKEMYLMKDEKYDDLFYRVSKTFQSDDNHGKRILSYMQKLWFMPATPILSNGGTDKGLPISCFLNEVMDTRESIADTYKENIFLASYGGGIGTHWSNLRSIGEKVKNGAYETSGIIPFIKIQDSMTVGISQGLRRGSSAAYISVEHPEIEEFLEIRRTTGGDPNRKCLNIHHGIIIPDKFMVAVQSDSEWDLISPKTKQVIKTINARKLWFKILEVRLETGEPYLLFIDNINKQLPKWKHDLGLTVKTSNLCSEITLPTGIDYNNKERTAVCCLSSLNLEKYFEWHNNQQFFKDVVLFLDNVLQHFIDNAPEMMDKAKYSSMMERSIGIGTMGFHGLMMSKNIPIESIECERLNDQIYSNIHYELNKVNIELGEELGSCVDFINSKKEGYLRFSNMTAIAPTASISIISNSTAGIDLLPANIYTHKNLAGSFIVKNKHLEKVLEIYNKNDSETWLSITNNNGSVQHLDFLSEHDKEVFKTAYEVDNQVVIDLASQRQKYIDQSQSLNLFLKPDINVKKLSDLHYSAWKQGVKSLYYLRSQSLQRSDRLQEDKVCDINNKECLSCQ